MDLNVVKHAKWVPKELHIYLVQLKFISIVLLFVKAATCENNARKADY